MFSADAFILDRTKIPRELHNAHFFSIHATKSLRLYKVKKWIIENCFFSFCLLFEYYKYTFFVLL
jgi:hypothetical protein